MNTDRAIVSSSIAKMFIWILFVGTAISTPTDELGEFSSYGGVFATHGLLKQNNISLLDVVDKNNKYYKQFNTYIKQGYAMKGLTFNIYDDNMREAAIALFRLLKDVDENDFPIIRDWASLNINDDLFEYAWRLSSLYYNKFGMKETEPPFITKPNYYINSETIRKALLLKMNEGCFNEEEAKVNQIYRKDDIITINTNYSGWNLPPDGCDEKLNYFTEDISLNSFYYGVHLLHPFWMSNKELNQLNPRHAEHHYFVHKQLRARYMLEKRNITHKQCDNRYQPYLVYDNGLSFPIRSDISGESNAFTVNLASKHRKIKESIKMRIINTENRVNISMTEDNYVDLLTRSIRENFDGIKTAKIVRTLLGCGRNGCPIDQYNPAPSLLHHPETSLRDPAYFEIIEIMLKYFTEFANSSKPYDLSKYETEEFHILSSSVNNITTYFNYYQFKIDNAAKTYYDRMSHVLITARQKRLNHLPFVVNITIESKSEATKEVVLRLFLGPYCYNKDICWGKFAEYFQLDVYKIFLKNGVNNVSWSPDTSNAFSSDDSFNIEKLKRAEKYNMFKFPKNVLIPKGLTNGLNATLFIMLTPVDNHDNETNYYRRYCNEVDYRPLGFPFHRQAFNYKLTASNYGFYNISIFHKKQSVDSRGYFSANLY